MPESAKRYRDNLEGLRRILNDDRFTGSPFHQFRDGQRLSVTKRTLDGLLAYMRQSAKDLSFEGVFLEEAEADCEGGGD